MTFNMAATLESNITALQPVLEGMKAVSAVESQYLLSETAAEHGPDSLAPVQSSDLKHSSLPIREQH